jgi:hypothetical protein
MRRVRAYVAAGAAGAVFGLAVALTAARWFGPGALPEVTAASFAAARATWDRAAPQDYDLEVVVIGRESATFQVQVRGGIARQAWRDGQSLPHERTWSTWTVPGMFETIARDLDSVARLREGKADPGTPQILLRGLFDAQRGFPLHYQRTEMRKFGPNQEVAWEVVRFQPL